MTMFTSVSSAQSDTQRIPGEYSLLGEKPIDRRGTEQRPLVISKPRDEQIRDERSEKVHARNESVATGATIALAIGTFVLAIFTWLLWEANRELIAETKIAAAKQSSDTQHAVNAAKSAADAAKISADASILALRPWLSCRVEIAGPLSFSENGDAHFKFKFTIKNRGKTPAMSVKFPSPRLVLLSPNHAHPILEAQKMADAIQRLAVPAAVHGGVDAISSAGPMLFPEDEPMTEFLDFLVPREVLMVEGDTFIPQLVGVIGYNYNLASVRAVTGFVYDIAGNTGVVFRTGETLNAEAMSISPNSLWGGFAS